MEGIFHLLWELLSGQMCFVGGWGGQETKAAKLLTPGGEGGNRHMSAMHLLPRGSESPPPKLLFPTFKIIKAAYQHKKSFEKITH